MAPRRLTPTQIPATAAIFLGSQQHTCQLEAVTRGDALLRAPVNVSNPTFARIHLHSADDGVLDLDAVVRRFAGAAVDSAEGYLLAVAFVDPPARYFQTLDRLSAALVEAAKGATPTSKPAPTPAPRRPTPTPTPRPRVFTPAKAQPPSAARKGGDSLSNVNTDPAAMLDLYRKALASDKREAQPEDSGSLWQKLKRATNKKL